MADKNNMATRYCDEILDDLRGKIVDLRKNGWEKVQEADIIKAQVEVLEGQERIIKDILAKGNYEKDNSKDA